MKAKALVGKVIARVEQELWDAGENRDKVWVVRAIHFTDSSCLRFIVAEGDADYGVVPIYPARTE